MKKIFFLLTIVYSLLGFTQEFEEPVRWTTQLERVSSTEFDLHFDASIIEKWHLYSLEEFEEGPLPTEFVYALDSLKIQLVGAPSSSTPTVEFDEVFQIDLPFFAHKARFTQRIRLLNPAVSYLSGEINYQACDDRVCIFRTEPFAFSLNGQAVNTPAISVSEEDQRRSAAFQLTLKNTDYLAQSNHLKQGGSSFWNLFLLGFLGGLIALLTPCVFPMIPLTVSFFLKQSGSLRKGIAQAFLYGAFIVLIYVLLSLPFHFLDSLNPEILNTISTNVPLNLVFFGVFVFFAFSFFGYYELTLPSSWGNATDKGSASQGMIGIFFMALTLAIVSFSCTGPILGSLLAGSLTAEGGAMQLTVGMTGFGVALALPFALFALFPNALQALPKSGGWMTTVKVVLGFLELALALKFLSNADLVSHWGLLKREVFIGIWTLLVPGFP